MVIMPLKAFSLREKVPPMQISWMLPQSASSWTMERLLVATVIRISRSSRAM